ncbi:GntR family transcriptional regulator [Enterococcus sp. HY326]|uniref:GntR family transcriptional regulator n=1 Tax=Enterococcus sp. HY326 TaxID=2971265 RepID=UPI00223F7AC1|nr:GntR family transcriptional regulator [Enterococcus sp. HY326]
MRDSSNKIPLYYQLVDTLQEQIENEMKPNDKLPTEKQIGEEYSMSRTTVRLAMQELEKRGFIYRIQGKGSFVSAIKPESLNSFFDLNLMNHYLGENRQELKQDILLFTKEPPKVSISQKMGLKKGQNVLKVHLLHKLRSTPVAFERLILKNQYFSFLTEKTLTDQGIDQLLHDNNLTLKAIEETYKVVNLSSEESEILEANFEPALAIFKAGYNEDNEMIVLSERKILTSKFCYQNFVGK